MRKKLAEDHMHVRNEHGVIQYCGKRAGWCHQNIFPNWRVFRVVPKQPAPQEPPLPSNGFLPERAESLCPATLGGMRCSLAAGHHLLHQLLYPDGRRIEWTGYPNPLVPRPQ